MMFNFAKCPPYTCKLRFSQSRSRNFFEYELFRIKLDNVTEFKDIVGVSDISFAFGCLLPSLWLTYIIIFSGISHQGCHYRLWSMSWSLFLYLFSFRKVGRERIREFIVHLISLFFLMPQSCEQHKFDHYFSNLVHLRNWIINLVSYKFIIIITLFNRPLYLIFLSVPERYLL